MSVKTVSLFSLLLLFLSTQLTYGGEFAKRRELKKMCKEEYKLCQKEKERKVCSQEKKNCRRENGVSLGDDLKFLFGEAKNLIHKALGAVKIEREQDEFLGYYTKVSVEALYLKFMPELTIRHQNFQSYVTLPESSSTRYLEFYLYDSDLKLENYVTKLQTSPGRSFPRFFDGRSFEFLYGVEYVSKKDKSYQFYFDSSHNVFGSFLPSKVVGEAIKAVNMVKSYIPYVGALLPEVTTIPINLKYQGTKIGRASLISQKSFENSAGIVVLFDHAVIAQSF